MIWRNDKLQLVFKQEQLWTILDGKTAGFGQSSPAHSLNLLWLSDLDMNL